MMNILMLMQVVLVVKVVGQSLADAGCGSSRPQAQGQHAGPFLICLGV